VQLSHCISGMKRANSAAPIDSYSNLPSVCCYSGTRSVPFGCVRVRFSTTANGLQNSWNLLFYASKSVNQGLKLAQNRLSFSANSAPANNGGRNTCSVMFLQQGKWLKFLRRICLTHRLSLILKALTVAYMSEMMRSRPCSCRFSGKRCRTETRLPTGTFYLEVL